MKEYLFCAFAYNNHDSSVSFGVGKKVVLVLEAERIFRKKKKGCNPEEMEDLINEGLKYLGKKAKDVSYWAMATLNNLSLTKSDIIDLQTGRPKEPYWKEICIIGLKRNILIINHHLSHAATYLLSPFEHAIITTCDGGGDHDPKIGVGECFAAYRGDKDTIERHEIEIPNLITGKTYASASAFIYNAKHCEGKLMALAAYGKLRKEYLYTVESIYRNLETVAYPVGEKLLDQAFPGLRGAASEPIPDERAKDFCATLQSFFVARRLENTKQVVDKLYRKGDNFVLAGGTGLNLDLNTSILNELPHMQHFIAPCCDDTGQSLGALCILINKVLGVRPDVSLPYLGMGLAATEYDYNTINKVIDVLLQNGVAILHHGQAEIGPRALGNRSLIVRPDSLEVKRKLSETIKQREGYRPLAPAVVEEGVEDYFVGPLKSPFMLYRYNIVESARGKIQGAIHYDNSARAQTVNRQTNPFFYDLIEKFGDRTGIYALLNTSLNLKGYPIANSIEDSLIIYDKIDGPKVLIYNGAIVKLSYSSGELCKNTI